MIDPVSSGPLRYFADLPDPRAHNVRHRLIDILVIALCAVLCDADGWDDFEDFAQAKADFFTSFLQLPHGVPSADTFRRVLSRLDPHAFEQRFSQWMQSVAQLSQGKLLAIDGKSLRRSFEQSWDKAGMAHMVSLFVQHNGQVFSQIKTDGQGHELAAIAQLLGMIDLQQATVTLDAIGCQKDIAKRILDADGQYVLAVKENQPTLHQAISRELDDMIRTRGRYLPGDHHHDLDAGHGRIEQRQVWVTDHLSWLKQAGDWPGLQSVAVVQATRDVAGVGVSVERRYYISSLPADAGQLARCIRGHWSVENQLHHVLDVSFHEDDSRIRRDHGPENVSRLRRIALNLLKANGDKHTKRKSIKGRRKIAAWNNQFLINLITG